MTVLDDEFGPLTKELIDEFGKPVSLRRRNEDSTDTFDPVTGVRSAAATAETTKTVTISPPARFKEEQINGDSVKQGDWKSIIAKQGLSFTPKLGDVLIVDGSEGTIVSIGPLYSGVDVAGWKIQVRQ